MIPSRNVAILLCLVFFLPIGCGTTGSPRIQDFTEQGTASWYGPNFNGKPTASGEKFNQSAMTAAHKTYPFGTVVRVTNLRNGRSVEVRINDRGPFVKGRIIDLSRGAAKKIDMIQAGTVPVRLDVLRWGPV